MAGYYFDYIKKHMVNSDNILTENDYESLQSYRKEKTKGRLTSFEAIKKELKL